ncbi:hypothetical protein B7463_g11897, partial [Scytalidium lignicola]
MDVQKDGLAPLIAERGVVVFRGQDFKDVGPEKQNAFGQYFGASIHARQKAFFVNSGFTKRIIGLKDEESDVILQLLFKDNRVTAHTAISDYDIHNSESGLRHGFRITTLGERPVGVNGLETVR